MDVSEVIKRRYSCREYQKKPVPDDLIRDVLEAGRLAPSAKNTQPWRFLVVRKGEKREAVLGVQPSFNAWMGRAPVFIVVLSDIRGVFSERYHLIDLGFAVENMLMRATELGLGTCVCGGAGWDNLTDALELKKGLKAVLVVTLGYPAGEIKPKHRKPLEEITGFLD